MSEVGAKVIPIDDAARERLESDIARAEALQTALEDVRRVGGAAIAVVHQLGQWKEISDEKVIRKEISDTMICITEAASKYL